MAYKPRPDIAVEIFMRPFVIKFLDEGIELGLLLQEVGAGGPWLPV
jgi:hypothetical protein